MRKILVLLVAVVMTISAVGAHAVEIPDQSGYVRQDYRDFSQYPLVPEGESVTVTIAVPRDDTYGVDANDKWWWKWSEQVTGINFEIESILRSAMIERKNLMFASNDLPDVLFGLELSANEIMLYGQTEELLLPLNDFINDDVMPNMTEYLNYDPTVWSLITCLDGNVYSYFGVREKLHGDSTRTFIDKDLLDAIGMDVPTTLDDFIAAMYAMKALNPDMIPLGGSASDINQYNSIYYIMNAVGYLSRDYNYGTSVAIRNGAATIPAADETFVEVLKIMNQFYNDGIISPDYYSIDNTMVNAQMADGKLGVYPFVPFTVNIDPDFYDHWVSVTPLTSEWNDTQQWAAPVQVNVGGWAMSAKSQYGELMSRYVDFLYTPLGINLSWMGPFTDSDYTLGMTDGWLIDPETAGERFIDVENGLYQNPGDYNNKVTSSILGAVGNYGVWPKMPDYDLYQLRALVQGAPIRETEFILSQPDPFFRASMYKYISPYEVGYSYPNVVYMEQDDVFVMQDLESVLVPYMRSEIAKFVTGARDLNEFDDYLAELKSMDVDTYVGFFKTNYENYLANAG